jgi:hypothetical protein
VILAQGRLVTELLLLDEGGEAAEQAIGGSA